MKWYCRMCNQTFRRFSKGDGVCPKCGFVPGWEADGYADDEEIYAYWQFSPVFEFRKWLRRKVKVLLRSVGLRASGR